MHLHIRFLAFEMAVFTAVAGMLSQNTPEWEEAYKRRLFCEMRMNLMEVEDEQTAVEEIQAGTDPVPTGVAATQEGQVVLIESETGEAEVEKLVLVPETTETSPEGYPGEVATSPESQAEDTVVEQTSANVVDNPVPVPSAPLYQIDGDTLDPGIADYLYRRLSEAGIGWFFEYSVCLIYQESRFDHLAQNPNGRDKGLFQFRVEFHPELDWRNPYQQVDLYVQMMANRAVAGCDPYMMVSRHNTSDYCPDFNAEYVAQVLQHLPKLRKG